MSHWGNVLKEARIRAGLTQEELAAEVGISVSYIRKMETGLLGPPRRNKAEMLADTLSITDVEERNAFFRAAEVGNDEDMQGFKLVKVAGGQQLRRRRGEAFASSPIKDVPVPPEHDVLKQQIEMILEKEGLSKQESSQITEVLAPHVRQLVRMVKVMRENPT